jgi:hypothetical protein
MNKLKQYIWSGTAALLAVSLTVAMPATKPPKEPAKIKIEVSPDVLAPGEEATLTVRLAPIEGVKINRYPRIKLKLPAVDSVVAEAVAEFGNPSPPRPDELEKNYFKVVDPLDLPFTVDGKATSGKHEVECTVTYNYCVIESGFCSRFKGPVKIPITVR